MEPACLQLGRSRQQRELSGAARRAHRRRARCGRARAHCCQLVRLRAGHRLHAWQQQAVPMRGGRPRSAAPVLAAAARTATATATASVTATARRDPRSRPCPPYRCSAGVDLLARLTARRRIGLLAQHSVAGVVRHVSRHTWWMRAAPWHRTRHAPRRPRPLSNPVNARSPRPCSGDVCSSYSCSHSR